MMVETALRANMPLLVDMTPPLRWRAAVYVDDALRCSMPRGVTGEDIAAFGRRNTRY